MRKLSRNGVDPPADWSTKVSDILPTDYLTEAARFESLSITNATRQDGFKKFAPAAMPQSGGDPTFKPLWSTVKAIKDTLDKMSEGRCAYCEQLINARRSGQVEHFKPKSLFPSLCYEMDNYFLACNGCNGSKSNKWPRTGSYIRPDVGDPEKKLTFTENGRVTTAGVCEADTKVTIKDFASAEAALLEPGRSRSSRLWEQSGTSSTSTTASSQLPSRKRWCESNSAESPCRKHPTRQLSSSASKPSGSVGFLVIRCKAGWRSSLLVDLSSG